MQMLQEGGYGQIIGDLPNTFVSNNEKDWALEKYKPKNIWTCNECATQNLFNEDDHKTIICSKCNKSSSLMKFLLRDEPQTDKETEEEILCSICITCKP